VSGGTGSSSRGGYGSDSGVDCAAIDFDAFLSSVNPSALNVTEVDQVLPIELRSNPRALVVIASNGEVLGAITKKVRELLRCIQQEVQFQALIKHISGGDVEVKVTPV
jgi:hypothetical protein